MYTKKLTARSLFLFTVSFVAPNTLRCWSWQEFTQWFSRNMTTQHLTKKVTIKPHETIHLALGTGNISLVCAPHAELTIHAHITTEPDLASPAAILLHTDEQGIHITVANLTKKPEKINYELTGPASAIYHLEVEKGNITAQHIERSLYATTEQGAVTIEVKKMHPHATISTQVGTGNTKITLPETVETGIDLHTNQGKIYSDLLVTLSPHTLYLNKNSWKNYHKNIRGFVSSGEEEFDIQKSGMIRAETIKGNIEIVAG